MNKHTQSHNIHLTIENLVRIYLYEPSHSTITAALTKPHELILPSRSGTVFTACYKCQWNFIQIDFRNMQVSKRLGSRTHTFSFVFIKEYTVGVCKVSTYGHYPCCLRYIKGTLTSRFRDLQNAFLFYRGAFENAIIIPRFHSTRNV